MSVSCTAVRYSILIYRSSQETRVNKTQRRRRRPHASKHGCKQYRILKIMLVFLNLDSIFTGLDLETISRYKTFWSLCRRSFMLQRGGCRGTIFTHISTAVFLPQIASFNRVATCCSSSWLKRSTAQIPNLFLPNSHFDTKMIKKY